MADMTQEQATLVAAFVKKLVGLGLKASPTRWEEGPVVTSYYFELDHSMPISKILNKAEDFALAAKAEKVYIQRIEGEVVITVPNKERKLVDFKDVLHWTMTDKLPLSQEIPIPLGVDPIGKKASLDLTEMPHILIAGETGSGKSVFEAQIVSTLGVCKTPEELELYLVDTKKMDLPLFAQLPHVQMVAETVLEFHKMFSHLLMECRLRLDKIKNMSVRNIKEYHQMGLAMPYKVVIIDELADVIDQDNGLRKQEKEQQKEDKDFVGQYLTKPTIKQWLKELAQISRAAGIHIIACTQRSSVKIVDGDIKVNLPCRIALRLPTGFDSRTILGTEGAENLLGKGDMLVQMPTTEVIKRFHGPYVSMTDISGVVLAADKIREMMRV